MRHLRSLLKPTRPWMAVGVLPAALGASYLSQQQESSSCKGAIPTSEFLYQPLSQDKAPKSSIEFDAKAPLPKRMEALILRVQDEICAGIEAVDGKKFQEDKWEREGHGGGGRSRILQDGNVFDKAGVGVSIIHGKLPPAAVKQMTARGKDLKEGAELPFYACGVSLVMHPHNPMAPTIHLNYRYFEVDTGYLDEDGKPKKIGWFGGGADLTPSYLFEEDARHFHAVYKSQLDKRDPAIYPKWKKACDEYFYIPHRQEGRGVGGFFFDDLTDTSEENFQMIRNCANSMLDAYVPILKKRKDMPFTKQQKEWQQIRRGRYVEFNIMYDRGTKFGLLTPGSRVESILMSLPLTARWEYMNKPAPGSWEEKTLEVLKNPVDWLDVPAVDLEKLSTGELLKELARRSE
ncbi:Oxygen-dependent coproporphyrinogen-III oxidase [Phytophthora fragariae]|uniref:coproporphyrinogen oxidase n=1 Tax=Phytophthora fragariae TaxID=53985 RepID=A0A6A3IA05_9STRA|nr:Oxygen-dependent coproporphyrinogen-III oxidase [Phytophthora fragariae]KAE8924478.1 Oxygen-dependent coproporphyrinogen-III oxidase [Phytophthora fragariae]KAE8978312.1 Oxygen-dependent coproporphyrinogen-III oxidase [Phytophthora fragariae]KAE9076913.1 Oxygen-dependent coproporphyrinogen-III oxidase [Phytophthora fragariae]KAE9095668.1 Oxygen-dependent coproporphyrinogen-III oxidase [Phytophthora fragariae]